MAPLPEAAFFPRLTAPMALASVWARAGHAGFDAVRSQYALAVGAGLLPRSLRASGRLEAWLAATERTTMGPLARRT